MAYQSKLEMPLADVKHFVAQEYGVQAEVVCVRAGYMSTTLRLDSGREKYVLKVLSLEEGCSERLGFWERLNQRFERSGIPVPGLVQTCGGDGYVTWENNGFQLWRFVEGNVFLPGNRGQLRAAGSMLGRMHRAGDELVKRVDSIAMWVAEIAELEKTWLDLEAMGGPPEMLEDLAVFRECLAGVRNVVVEGLPVSIIHGDYRAQNLLYCDEDVVAVLDLDAAQCGMRLFDLAYGCMFFQAVIAARPLTVEEIAVLVCAYDREAGLTDGERAALPGFLLLALLKGMTLWMRIGYLDRVNDQALAWLDAYRPLLGWIAREGEGFASRVQVKKE
ncbi:MAG: phosphotransferase [bacterium]|nr:phosphotransferase [bacterium]